MVLNDVVYNREVQEVTTLAWYAIDCVKPLVVQPKVRSNANYVCSLIVKGTPLVVRPNVRSNATYVYSLIVKSTLLVVLQKLERSGSNAYEGMLLKITYKGKISGDEIKFSRNMADIADEPFVAKRSK